MAEPTYDELKAKLQELEKQKDEKAQRRHRIPRKREGRRERVRPRPVSGDALLRAMDAAARHRS